MYRYSDYKEQYRANLKLAFPVVLTQLGQILVQFADNVMVGRYGGDDPTPLAAVSFGGSVWFILFIAGIGFTVGITPLVGELYARGDHSRSSLYLRSGILFYTVLGLAIAALQLAVTPLMYRFGQPVEVVDMSLPYYRLLAGTMPFVMLFCAFKQFLEGVGNTRAEMVVVLACNLINIVLNWVLIYGRMGFPALGAVGAGLATLLSRMMMPVMIIAYFRSRERYRRYLTGFTLRSCSWTAVRRLTQIGVPISMQMFLESSAFVGTSIMMGWFGTAAISANQITTTLGNCAFMIVMSVGVATTIRISHCYGARNFDELRRAAHASYHLALGWNALAALCFILFREQIPMLFTTNSEVIALASQLLVFVALFQLSDGIQSVSVGVLRGIQDVKVIMPIAFLSYWVLNLPVGYLFGFVLDMGPRGLVLGFAFGLSVAGLMMILRIRRQLRKLLPDVRR